MPISIAATNEIIGAISLNFLDNSNIAELRKDPHAFINAHADIAVDEAIAINFVDNSADKVNLILPYYASYEDISAQVLGDADLNVSGGEIVFAVFFTIKTILIAVGGSAAAIASSIASNTAVAAGGIAGGTGAASETK